MTFRRFLIAFGILLVLFLSLYTWNRNSHVLDNAASSLGLEAAGFLIAPMRDAEEACVAAWKRYVDLVDVREENERLKAKVRELEAQILGGSLEDPEQRLAAQIVLSAERRMNTD